MHPIEKAYLFFYHRKKKKALRNIKKLPFPVISIGNITIGGTGKTPFTLSLAKELKKRGFIPIVLTRGYKGKHPGPILVTPQMKAEEVGDEPLMIAHCGYWVIKCADRYKGGLFALENFKFSKKDKVIFLVDDGFQHWRLYRDLNLLLIDGYRGFGNRKIFPFGPLRSPLSEIKEAHMVFITKRENKELKEEISKNEIKDIYFIPLQILGIFDQEGNRINAEGKSIFAFSGIGNFESFIKTLKRLNLNIKGYKEFLDHKKYSERTIKRLISIAKNAQLLVTTKKDFVKIKQLETFIPNLHYIDIEFEIEEGIIDKILTHLNRIGEN